MDYKIAVKKMASSSVLCFIRKWLQVQCCEINIARGERLKCFDKTTRSKLRARRM